MFQSPAVVFLLLDNATPRPLKPLLLSFSYLDYVIARSPNGFPVIRFLPLISPAQLLGPVAPSLDHLALIAKQRYPVLSQSKRSRDHPMRSNIHAVELLARV